MEKLMNYCNCKEPKLITNEAYGKEFQVCAKSKGGCGEEYISEVLTIELIEQAYRLHKLQGVTPIFIDESDSLVDDEWWSDDVPF